MKITRKLLIPLVTLFLFQCAILNSWAWTAEESAAIDAAYEFLTQVDHGAVDEAYESMTEIYKKECVKDLWIKQFSTKSQYYGGLINRTISKILKLDSLQYHPDGNYLKIHYRSEFEHKKNVYETVDLKLEDGNTWRVSGYFCN